MAVFPFVGPSYVYRSVNFDCQRSVNVYPVSSETGTSKAISGLQGTPGLDAFSTPAVAATRGSHTVKGRCFFVVGNNLFEIARDGSNQNLGTLLTSSGFVSMSDNGTQLIMVDNPNGYVLTLASNTFQQITSPNWLGAVTVTYDDSYFIFNKPDSGIYFISQINDGIDFDSLDFASAEGSPDDLVAVQAVHRQVWLLGVNSVEVVFDSGAPDFPFQRIDGTFIEYGCISAGSVSATANTLFWVGNDSQGSGIVWMANGYQPQRISTFAVEYLLQQYDLSNVTSYTYQEDGHYFYILNVRNANTTLAYDINLQQWHERCYFNLDTGEYERHRGQCHAYAFGKHLVGDYENGIIYEQSLNIYDDNGNPKRWMRTCPHLAEEGSLNYFYYDVLQIDMETGVGLVSGPTEDVTPQIMLRWSDDGGHNWSNEHWRSAGAIGAYKQRVRWNRLGRSRDRVFQAAGSTNTKVFLIAAKVDGTLGAN